MESQEGLPWRVMYGGGTITSASIFKIAVPSERVHQADRQQSGERC